MAKTTIELPDVLHRKLRVKAALDGRSMNELLVEAVQEHLRDFRFEPGLLEVDTVSCEGTKEVPNGRATRS